MAGEPDSAEWNKQNILGRPEELFRALVDGVQDYALFMTDDAGIVITWNPGARRLFGWQENEILGQHVRVVFTPEDRDAGVPEREMEQAVRAGHAADDRWQLRKDGSRFFANGASHPVWNDAGALIGFTKIVADATARHETEIRLQRKAALVDLASDAIIVHEAGTNRIILWNRGAEATYGWTRDEAMGEVAGVLLRTEFPVSLRVIRAALETGGHWEGDLVHTCRDGQKVIVASRWALQREADGTPIAVLEVNRDVTAQRRQQAESAASAAEQRRIAEALQRSLLLAPPPDAFPGVTVKALYQSAHDDMLIGGDFFDIFAVERDRIALVVGDVTGKGLEAATYTAEIKFAVRAFLRESPHPATALLRANALVGDKERLDPDHLGGSYVALSLVILDTRENTALVASAGAEPPFVVRAATGETVEFSNAGGPLLGALEHVEYRAQCASLQPGDVIAMSTDGLTEARRRVGRSWDLFGYDRLVATVCEEAMRNPATLSDAGLAVVDRVREFAGGSINDDVCLLLARCTHRAEP